MRIGIHFREAELPQGGGGHVFETGLLSALLEGPTYKEDSFVFLGPSGYWLDAAAARGHETQAIPILGVKRAWSRLPRVRNIRSLFFNEPGRGRLTTRIDRLVARTGVEFLWCLGPDVPSFDVPFLVTVWDLQHRLQPFFPEVSAGGVWEKRERYFSRTLRRATMIVTGTEAGRREVTTFYGIPKDRIHVLPHPTPNLPQPNEADEKVLERLGLEPGYLLYPAQFWPHKAHVTLLYALRHLVDGGRDARAVFVGSDWGGNRRFVETQIDHLGLRDRVRILGFVARQDLTALYRCATALTYPSLFGPENLPPLEALSVGCPVIAAGVSGAEEQLGDAALLFSPTDAQDLSKQIERLWDDEDLRATLIARGRDRGWTPAQFSNRALEMIREFAAFRRTWPS